MIFHFIFFKCLLRWLCGDEDGGGKKRMKGWRRKTLTNSTAILEHWLSTKSCAKHCCLRTTRGINSYINSVSDVVLAFCRRAM